VAAPEIASEYSQQIVETEHLLKALLEQPNGLARRVINKAGSDASRLLDKTDEFIRRQPRVSGDTAQQVRLRRVCSVLASVCAVF
jgi:ATP-dependent Clp protease ATP-binding subunit ClpB